jgi:hypothetical protein
MLASAVTAAIAGKPATGQGANNCKDANQQQQESDRKTLETPVVEEGPQQHDRQQHKIQLEH